MKRRIIFALVCICLTAGVFAQVPADVISDTKKQIAELEKDIVKAKTDKLDAATISGMELQLKTMKQMMALLDKTSSPVKQPASAAPAPAKPLTPGKAPPLIETIPLKQPVQVPTIAQAKDKLLWYKGRKINDSILVTPKGLVVLFSKKRNLVVTQQVKKADPFLKLANNLAKSKQWTEDYINREASRVNGFMNYPLVQLTVNEFNDIDERFSALVKNTIPLPLPAEVLKNDHGALAPKGGMGSRDYQPEGELDAMHAQLQELLRNPPSMNFEPPPKKDFSLAYFCDSSAQKKYKQERQQWEEEFLQYENELMRTSLAISRFMELTGAIPIGKSEPGAPTLNESVQEAMTQSLERTNQKIQTLTGQNGKNIFMQDCVLSSILGNERKKQIMGLEDEGGAMTIVTDLLESGEFESYMNEQIQAKNFDVIFNVSVTLGRNRQTQLLAVSGVSERLNQLFLTIMELNRFALTMDVDFDMHYLDYAQKPTLKASGLISTKQKVYLSMARTGCKWTLHLTNTNYEGGKEAEYYLPMVIKGGTKMIKMEEDRWKSYPYSGPADMLMHLPVFKIDFGHPLVWDTIIVESLRYDATDLSRYAASVKDAYTVDFMGYLMNVFVSGSRTEMNENELMNMANDMISKFSKSVPGAAAISKLAQLRDKYERMQQKLKAEEDIANMSAVLKTTIEFQAYNNNEVLVSRTVDMTHNDKQMDLKKGIIKILVVHDPPVN